MDENGQEKSSLFSRYRSPSFRQAEVKALVQLVQKYKCHIINKSTNSAANYTKELAWGKIAKEFNRQGLGLDRSVDVLRTKWENLKRSARRLAKDVMDDDWDCNRDEINKTVMMICGTDNGLSEYDEQRDFEDEREEFKPWASEDEHDSVPFVNDSAIQNETPKKSESGFSPGDCRILLQCVRQEKNVLFSKASASAFKRQQAWKRITENYNKQSPRKKSAKELNKKFINMKAMAKKINIEGYFKDVKRKKYEILSDDMDQKIKSEPIIDCTTDFDFDDDDDKVLSNTILLRQSSNNSHLGFTQDPLNNAHNSDSGLGSISDTKDVARLKVDLLNYKMETARLERKRIEEALEAEEKNREMQALEQSLRLRAARLEVAAAESKLPPSHPALKYSVEERRAQQYLCNDLLD